MGGAGPGLVWRVGGDARTVLGPCIPTTKAEVQAKVLDFLRAPYILPGDVLTQDPPSRICHACCADVQYLPS